MKPNLLSTLTQQSAWSLFFLTLLNMKKSEAGQAFKNCLTDSIPNGAMIYDNIVKFSLDISNIISHDGHRFLCCNSDGCLNISNEIGNECRETLFNCKTTSENSTNSISYCHPWEINSHSLRCAGDVGDILNNKGCNNDKLVNYLKTLTPIGLDKGYALYNLVDNPATVGCGYLSNCKYCNWDNNWVICYGSAEYGCHISFSWPGTAANKPSVPDIATTTITLSTPKTISMPTTVHPQIPTPTYNKQSDDNLVGKIAIPVGSITGVSLTSFLTYYYCKKKKRKAKLKLENNLPTEDNSEVIEEIELTKKDNDTAKNLERNNSLFPAIKQNQSNHSEHNDLSLDVSEQKLEIKNDNQNNQLNIWTSYSPSSSQTITVKEQLINQLKSKLIGFESLWNNYLEVNNLMFINPQSQFISQNFSQLQDQLLQILTISEIGLLLENNVGYLGSLNNQIVGSNEIFEEDASLDQNFENSLQRKLNSSSQENNQAANYSKENRNPHTEYTETFEQNPRWFPISNNPQSIRYGNPQWRG